MSTYQRRKAMWEYLCQERYTTYQRLANHFGVCKRTAQNDIQVLTRSHPIVTVSGRHGGGVQVPEWFHQSKSVLNPVQADLLNRLLPMLSEEDRLIAVSILSQFAA